MQPPKCSFNIKNWIIILYSFCTILYIESQIVYTIPYCAIGNSNLGAACHHTPQCRFNTKKWITILYSFFPLSYTEAKIFYTIPYCAIDNSDLGGWWHAASQMQFQHKKLDHNFVLTLYKFVHRVPNFLQHSHLRCRQFKFGGLVTCSPHPQMQFQHKKLDHKFVLILYLYTEFQILYTIQSCAIGNSNLGWLVTCSLRNAVST